MRSEGSTEHWLIVRASRQSSRFSGVIPRSADTSGQAPTSRTRTSWERDLMIAEIVAGEASRIIMERRFTASGDLDAPAFYSEHLTYMHRYLMRCHRMMVSDSEL